MNTYKHVVQYYETDKMGITHHSNYVRFMEEARVSFLEKIGWGYDKLEKEGVISPVISISCDYKKPTTFADEIEIEISVALLTRVKFTINYVMRVGDDVVCTAQSSHCFVSQSGRPISIQKQYPEFFAALSAFNVAGDEDSKL